MKVSPEIEVALDILSDPYRSTSARTGAIQILMEQCAHDIGARLEFILLGGLDLLVKQISSFDPKLFLLSVSALGTMCENSNALHPFVEKLVMGTDLLDRLRFLYEAYRTEDSKEATLRRSTYLNLLECLLQYDPDNVKLNKKLWGKKKNKSREKGKEKGKEKVPIGKHLVGFLLDVIEKDQYCWQQASLILYKCTAYSRVSTGLDSTHWQALEYITQQNGIQICQQRLIEKEDPTWILGILSNLAAEGPEFRKMICSNSACIFATVDLLRSESKTVRENALWLLASVSECSKEVSTALIRTKSTTYLLEILQAKDSPEDMILGASMLLVELTRMCKNNLEELELSLEDCIQSVFGSLQRHYENEDIKEVLKDLFLSLASHKDCFPLLRKHNAIQFFVDFLEDKKIRRKQTALSIIASHSDRKTEIEYLDDLCAAGLVAKLLNLIKPNQKGYILRISLLLLSLCTLSRKELDKLIQLGGFNKLLDLLSHCDSSGCIRIAAGILQSIVTADDLPKDERAPIPYVRAMNEIRRIYHRQSDSTCKALFKLFCILQSVVLLYEPNYEVDIEFIMLEFGKFPTSVGVFGAGSLLLRELTSFAHTVHNLLEFKPLDLLLKGLQIHHNVTSVCYPALLAVQNLCGLPQFRIELLTSGGFEELAALVISISEEKNLLLVLELLISLCTEDLAISRLVNAGGNMLIKNLLCKVPPSSVVTAPCKLLLQLLEKTPLDDGTMHPKHNRQKRQELERADESTVKKPRLMNLQ